MKKLPVASMFFFILMFIAPLSIELAQTTNQTWNIQKVAPTSTDWCGRGGIGGVSLSVDCHGTPHIFYTMSYYAGGYNGYSQKYASSNGTGWNIETLEGGSVGSFALDSVGNPHVCFLVNPWVPKFQFVWCYSFFDGSRWHTSTIDENGDFGSCSLALDSNGNPRVIYDGCEYISPDHSVTATSLRYAYLIGEKWNIQTVSTSGNVAGSNSLALDSTNKPHILFLDGETLEYAALTGLDWTTQVIDQKVKYSPSLVLDSSGNPHVIYNDRESLKYAVLNGAKWDIQVLSKDGYGGSLALDSHSNPHVSYFVNSTLEFASWTGCGWSTQQVVQNASGSTSLAFDADDNPYICYCNSVDGLMYATLGSAPPTETAGSFFNVSQYGFVAVPVVIFGVAILAVLLLLRKRRVRKSN
jgi:hypothetical protein